MKRFGGAEKAFHTFQTGADGCLSRAEMEAAIAEITKELGRLADTSLKELENAVASASVSAIAFGSWADDVCARVAQALQRENRTVDELFEALAGSKAGRPEIHWPDFRGLFARLDPTLTDGQLRRLWQLFDKNGDGGVSRDEFHRALEPHREVAAPPDPYEAVASLPVLLSRLARALGPKLPAQALSVYSRGIVGLTLEAWLDACRGLSLPFSRYEATALHAALARGPGGGAVSPEALAAEVNRTSARGVPEETALGPTRTDSDGATNCRGERWARDFVAQRMQLAHDARECTVAEAVQAAADGEAIHEDLLRSALGRHQAVPDDTWGQLRLLMERRFEDGLVLWRPFLQWVCGFGGGAPMGTVADMVCSRVSAALRKEKKSAEQLFNALAGVKAAVYWQDFCAFFSQMERSLSEQQLQELWYSFDKNGDGSAVTEAICARVNSALRREGKTVDELFNALAGVKDTVHWPDFQALFSSLEPTLRAEQLEHFRQDGDGGISRQEFRKALSSVGISAPERVTQPPVASQAPPVDLQELQAPLGRPVVLRSKRDVEVRHRKRDREILSLAWPAVLGASIDPVLSLLDTYWVSRCLGMVALAALGPALNVEDWMFDILKTVQPRKPQDVLQTLTQALCFCWRVGLVVALMGSVLAPLLLRLSSVEASSPLLEPAKAYLVPRLWGSPGLLTLIVLQATLSGAFRDTTAVLRLVLLGAFLNAVLTPLAVVGMHGGTAGAAWATTVSCYASAVCAWIMVARRPGGPWLPQPRKLFATAFLGKEVEGESKGWGKLLAANAAMTLRSFSSLTTWLVACSIITKIGVAPLAAHTCMTKTFLSFLYWMYGFQLASQVLVSADVAKGLPRRARWTALRAMRMAMLVASATALALWVGRESIAAALVRDLLVIQSFETLGQTVDHLFDALAGGRSEVRWPDFNDFFRQLEPSLKEDDLMRLWQTFDANADGGISREEPIGKIPCAERANASLREEFRKQLAKVQATTSTTSAAAPSVKACNVSEEICSMVAAMLRREGKTQEPTEPGANAERTRSERRAPAGRLLFDALANGQTEVAWSDFRALFAQLEPHLSAEQLEELWRHFDKNNDGGVSREEFRRALGAVSTAAEDVAQDTIPTRGPCPADR
eukprot:g1877.t1